MEWGLLMPHQLSAGNGNRLTTGRTPQEAAIRGDHQGTV